MSNPGYKQLKADEGSLPRQEKPQLSIQGETHHVDPLFSSVFANFSLIFGLFLTFSIIIQNLRQLMLPILRLPL